MDIEQKILQIPIEDIIPNRFQPRLAFDDTSLNDLAESIKVHGIIQPLVLRRNNDKYEIVAGERRYKAAKMAGLTSVPAILSNLDDNQSAEVAIVENVQRKGLTAIEEAKSYKALLDKGYMSQEELARRMGLSQSAISNKLRLLTLDEEVQEAILNERISERHARSLLKIKDLSEQKKLLKKIIEDRLTVKQLEDEIKKITGDEINDVPIIKEEIKLDNIIKNSTDINPSLKEMPNLMNTELDINKNFEEAKSEKVPNKFFNFLEDEEVNMDTNIEMPLVKHIDEEVELLDDAPIENNNNKKQEILTKIKDLLQNENNITINESENDNKYQIIISISKEEN